MKKLMILFVCLFIASNVYATELRKNFVCDEGSGNCADIVQNVDRDTDVDGLYGVNTNAMLFGRVDDDTIKGARLDAATEGIITIGYEHHEIHSGSHYYIEGTATLGNTDTLYAKLVTPNTDKWSHFVWNISSNGVLTTNFYEIPTGGMANGNRAVIHSNNRNTNSWSGRQEGGDDKAVLSDSTQSWTPDELVDMQIFNQTDGSSGLITTNSATIVTATLAGSTTGNNDWDNGDVYEINNSRMVITSGVTVATDLGLLISTKGLGGEGFKADVGGTSQRTDEIMLKQNTTYLRTFLSGSDGNVVSFKASWYEHQSRNN